MAGVTFTREEEIAVPSTEQRLAVRKADWVRLRRCIRDLQHPFPSLPVWYSVLFGIAGSAATTVVPLGWAQGLPTWVVPTYIVVACAAALLAGILAALDRKVSSMRASKVSDLNTDLDEVEGGITKEPSKEPMSQIPS